MTTETTTETTTTPTPHFAFADRRQRRVHTAIELQQCAIRNLVRSKESTARNALRTALFELRDAYGMSVRCEMIDRDREKNLLAVEDAIDKYLNS